MLPGFDGHLVSRALLEQRVNAALDPVGSERRRAVAEWRSRATVLGPASSTTALLQISAAPLAEVLGFEPPTRIEFVDNAIASTLTGGARPVALLVTPWAEPFDRLWRAAVTQALQRAAAWCLLFDGIHLRIIDATRLYARRYIGFDLDLALDSPSTVAAFWQTASAQALTAEPTDPSSL